jgi:quercetin dioxygenase-like cupin family protein
MKRAFVCGTLALFALVTSLGISQAQTPVGHDVRLFSSVFPGVATPARYFSLAQAVVEYGPGAFSVSGSEQSIRFFTVMEGDLQFTIGSKTDIYGGGKGFLVPAGVIVKGSNEGRTARARVYVSSLVPARGEGAVTVPGSRESSPPPARLCSTSVAVGPLPSVIDVIQVGHRYEPGFVTRSHIMNQLHYILQVEGTNFYEYVDGAAETYGPCQVAQMYVHRPGTMGNRSSAPSVWLITTLAIPGQPEVLPWP